MITRILTLSPQLANQIAAGEVVERPSSVVKELLENSLDAGSTQIEINIEKGGMQRIHIADNGQGICKEDLPLAVSRHATSKIKSLTDLEALYTLGFRGEALASVASVSRMRLASKPPEQDQAWQIAVSGRDDLAIDVSPIAHPNGTTVWIDQLFYNTPARRKFLKSERTEFDHIEEVVRRMSLSRYDVAFVLKHNQRPIFQLPAIKDPQSPLQRIKKIFGNAFAEQIIECQAAAVGITLQGWVGQANFHRSQNDLQYFYVNGRIIRDKVITHAIHQAYANLIPTGRYPAYILYLTIEPEQVDVNVHPTKHEVRFRQARLVHDFIVTRLQESLQSVVKVSEAIPPNPLFSKVEIIQESSYSKGESTRQSPYSKERISNIAIREQEAFYRPVGGDPCVRPGSGTEPTNTREVNSKTERIDAPLQVNILSKIDNAYLLCDYSNLGILLVDTHAAFANLARDRLMNNPQSQTLLLPETFVVKPVQLELLEKNKTLLSELGFDWDRLGEQHLVLRSVPAVLRYAQYSLLIECIVNSLTQPPPAFSLVDSLACLAKPLDLQSVDIAFLNAVLAFTITSDSSSSRLCQHRRRAYVVLEQSKLELLIKS